MLEWIMRVRSLFVSFLQELLYFRLVFAKLRVLFGRARLAGRVVFPYIPRFSLPSIKVPS